MNDACFVASGVTQAKKALLGDDFTRDVLMKNTFDSGADGRQHGTDVHDEDDAGGKGSHVSKWR